MPIDEDMGARLAAYLDGEADEAERRAVEAALERDPAARQALDNMRAARDLVREYDTHTDVSTVAVPEPPALVGTQVDHFLVECPLGRGGMGQVYRAVDTSLNRPVAVKIISPRLSGDAQVVDRFVREARLQSQIDHPHVAHVYFVGRHEGRRYFAMEYLPGGSLEDRLRKEGRLDPEEAIRIVLEVADILESVRRSDVVHRDLKPSNIMFTADGSIKLADFGIARSDDGDETQLTDTGAVLGTPQYISPEAAADKPVTWRSDMYSLGCTLYRLLFGRPPYTHKGTVQLAVAHIREPFPEPDELPPGVGPELMDVLRRMMAKEPADRFEDYGSLIAALNAARPRLIEPIGPWRRIGVGVLDALVAGGLFLVALVMAAGVLSLLKLQGAVQGLTPLIWAATAVVCHGMVPALTGSTLAQGVLAMKVRPDRPAVSGRWRLLFRGVAASPMATIGLLAVALRLVPAPQPRGALGLLLVLAVLGWHAADAVALFRDLRRRPLHDVMTGTRLQHVTYQD